MGPARLSRCSLLLRCVLVLSQFGEHSETDSLTILRVVLKKKALLLFDTSVTPLNIH